MTVVLKRTSFGERRFDNLSGGHLQTQVEMNATTTNRREKSVIPVTDLDYFQDLTQAFVN